MRIIEDDLIGLEIVDLLCFYLVEVYWNLLLGLVFVFDIDCLCVLDVMFWLVWDGDELVGCVVLKEFVFCYGEVKLMCMVLGYFCKGVVM